MLSIPDRLEALIFLRSKAKGLWCCYFRQPCITTPCIQVEVTKCEGGVGVWGGGAAEQKCSLSAFLIHYSLFHAWFNGWGHSGYHTHHNTHQDQFAIIDALKKTLIQQ